MNTVLHAYVSYNAVVDALGQPEAGCDKTHVEWAVETQHGTVSVYDYGDLGACCHRDFYEGLPTDFDDFDNLKVPDPADGCPMNPKFRPDALPPVTGRSDGAFHVNAGSAEAAREVYDRLVSAYSARTPA